GLTLLPVFYAHANFGATPPLAEQRRFVNNLDGFARIAAAGQAAMADVAFARIGVAPHSLRAVTPDELAALVSLAGVDPVHIHVAEQATEVADCLAWRGARPTRLLFDLVPVDERWCLVHATHVDREEVTAIARSGAVVGLCPVTEANLGDGIFPARSYLDDGGRFGIGTDSHVTISAAEELRLLEYAQRLALRARNVCAPAGSSTGLALYLEALAGGRQALGRSCGMIAPRQVADLVTLDAQHPCFANHDVDTILDAWVFAGGRAVVDGVWSAGEKRVTGGCHHERAAIAARFRTTMRAMRSRLPLP
ncbi:MAG: amidohydrolase family protein, partial [Rhodospirillales bacterium]|nr:amidohydrolase family protein [Rhodospirillales bacterium]